MVSVRLERRGITISTVLTRFALDQFETHVDHAPVNFAIPYPLNQQRGSQFSQYAFCQSG